MEILLKVLSHFAPAVHGARIKVLKIWLLCLASGSILIPISYCCILHAKIRNSNKNIISLLT